MEDGGKTTMRSSVGSTIDYKLTPNDRVSLSLELTMFDSPLNQRTLSFFVNRVAPGDFTTTSTHGQVGRGEVRNTSQSRHHSRVKYMPSLVYRHNGPTNDTEIYGPATPEHAQFRQRTTYGSLWSFGVKGSF